MSSSPGSTVRLGTRSVHSAAASCGTRKTAARRPSSLSRTPVTIPVPKKMRIESRSGRTTQARFVIEPGTCRLRRLGGRRARRSAPRATRRPGRGSGAPRRASRTRASPRRRRLSRRGLGARARRPSPRPPTGAWSSRTKTSLERETSATTQSVSKRLSHGIAITRTESSPLSARPSAARRASWSITGPYAISTASPPSRTTRPRRSQARRRDARSAVAKGRSRASARHSRPRPRPPSGPPRVSSRCRLDDRDAGSAPSNEMSRMLWCDLPGPAGISPA